MERGRHVRNWGVGILARETRPWRWAGKGERVTVRGGENIFHTKTAHG